MAPSLTARPGPVTAATLLAVGLLMAPAGVVPAAAAGGCSAFFDADGDGHDDLAVGVPGKDVTVTTARKDAGAVTILLGDAQGRFGRSGSVQLTQESVGQASAAGDRFGAALATADLDGDGCADLVVGAPGESQGAGSVVVVYGSATGLDTEHPQVLRQGAAPVGGSREAGDGFGSSLTVSGTRTTGGPAALWVGSPGEDVGKAKDAGLVTELRTTAGGEVGSGGTTSFTQNSAGVPGTAETGDRFGERLAGGSDRLLVGVPHEDLGAAKDAGTVYVFGIGSRGWATYTQDTAGMPGAAETGDRFGGSVAQAAGCKPPNETWVIGAPGEDIRSATNAGIVTLWDRGTRRGLAVQQGAAGIPDQAEAGDAFGAAVLTATPDGGLVAVSAPREDRGSDVDAGQLVLLGLDCRSGAPAVASALAWDQDTPQVAGSRDAGNLFGSSLGASLVDTATGAEPRLVVSSPGQTDGGKARAGLVTVFVGSAVPGAAGSVAIGQSSAEVVGEPAVGDAFGGGLDATNALLL